MVTRFTGRTAAVLAGLGASFVFAGAPALAQEATIVVQTAPPANMRIERVSYRDLNLATKAGEQSLQRRVNQAVERVCLQDKGRWYGLGEPAYTYCTWGAWERARPQMVGAVHRARQLATNRRY
jgi:UrcA family protein